jgi:hypothetical protein
MVTVIVRNLSEIQAIIKHRSILLRVEPLSTINSIDNEFSEQTTSSATLISHCDANAHKFHKNKVFITMTNEQDKIFYEREFFLKNTT